MKISYTDQQRLNMKNTTPILFLSDHPAAQTGLGRICRDLALRLHLSCGDIFRVATFGYGSPGSQSLPFPQYYMTSTHEWMTPDLPEVWDDFAGEEPGIVFTIWDASRMLWFARPENPQYCPQPRLQQFLQSAKITKWGYFPIDATGPGNRLSVMLKQCLLGYHRILAYSTWARHIIERTLGDDARKRGLFSLPHGIDTEVFRPRDRSQSREIFHSALGFKGPLIQEDEMVIGIVATNQKRKDFGLGIRAVAEVARQHPVRLFIHTDVLERHWSIPALLMDYGLLQRAIVNTGVVPDEAMSYIYSACDVTLGIGSGEGFGYPIFESLACGTPCITGNYGGQAEWMPAQMLVEPEMKRLEGVYDSMRPVFAHGDWVDGILHFREHPKANGTSLLPQDLAWENLWSNWETYFRQSHQNLRLADGSPVDSSNTLGTDTAREDHGTSLIVSPEEASARKRGPLVAFPAPES